MASKRTEGEAGLDDNINAKRPRPETSAATVSATPQPSSGAPPLESHEQVPQHLPYSSPRHTEQEFDQVLDSLSVGEMKGLLMTYALYYPSIEDHLFANHNAKIRAKQSMVKEFDYYSKSIWREINRTHSRLSGSRQYEVAGEVFHSVEHQIRHIEKEAALPSSFGTRCNALVTLRKIGKTICLSGNDVVGHEVKKNFQWSPSLVDAMFHIVETFNADEKNAMLALSQDGSTFKEKLEELIDLANDHCVHDGLHEVRDALEDSSSPTPTVSGDSESDNE